MFEVCGAGIGVNDEAKSDAPGLGENAAMACVSCTVVLLGAAVAGSTAGPPSCALGGALAGLADTPLIDHSRPTWPIGAVPAMVLLLMS